MLKSLNSFSLSSGFYFCATHPGQAEVCLIFVSAKSRSNNLKASNITVVVKKVKLLFL